MSRGRQFAANCGLCFAEPSTTAIAGVQLGARCFARAMAIAAESRVAVEEPVRRASVGGVVCTDCGAELEVDEAQLAVRCPNGHAVRIRPRPDAPTSAPAPAVCARCARPIERTPGQRGRTPKVHPECQSEADRHRLAKQRLANEARHLTNPGWWKKYQKPKAGVA